MSKYYDSTNLDKDLSSPNIIAEERASYALFKKSFLTPYADRTDLSTAEKVCIGNYQDYHSWNEQKTDWSFEVPDDWKAKSWCFAINNCCRFLEF